MKGEIKFLDRHIMFEYFLSRAVTENENINQNSKDQHDMSLSFRVKTTYLLLTFKNRHLSVKSSVLTHLCVFLDWLVIVFTQQDVNSSPSIWWSFCTNMCSLTLSIHSALYLTVNIELLIFRIPHTLALVSFFTHLTGQENLTETSKIRTKLLPRISSVILALSLF